jgi:hypothetical protein
LYHVVEIKTFFQKLFSIFALPFANLFPSGGMLLNISSQGKVLGATMDLSPWGKIGWLAL